VILSQLFWLLRPLLVLLAALFYLLGAGIADYLGIDFVQDAFWLGLLWTILLQLTVLLLARAFARQALFAGAPTSPAEQARLPMRLALAAGVLLISIAGTTVLMQQRSVITAPIYFIQIAAVLLVLGYSVPPLRLNQTGFGELLLAIVMAVIPPAHAFLLQAGDYHRLLSLVTFPLLLLSLAWLLALSFQSFATDQKYDRRTLLRMLGWERAVPLHHALILSSYGLWLMGPLVGISLRILWPAFLGAPFAILQILVMQSIAAGGRPNWTLLTATSTAVVGLTVYFLTVSFWLG